jgi:hypothetical protein
MRDSVRVRLAVGLALTLAVAGLAGCGRQREGTSGGADSEAAAPPAEETTELTLEAQALEAIGFTEQELGPAPATSAEPSGGSTAGTDDGRRHPRFKRMRFALRRDMLHGEAVVQTDQGTKTVVVQRGAVTAIDGSTVTVKSADGFTLTWKFGTPLHVVEHRNQIQPSSIAVGTTVGVAGVKEGDTPVARLIVVPGRR